MAAKLTFEERQRMNELIEEYAGGDMEDFGYAVWEEALKTKGLICTCTYLYQGPAHSQGLGPEWKCFGRNDETDCPLHGTVENPKD